jgi:hypothetical protein
MEGLAHINTALVAAKKENGKKRAKVLTQRQLEKREKKRLKMARQSPVKKALFFCPCFFF